MTLRNSLVYSSPLCTQAEVEACILNIATCQETKKQGSPFTDFNSQQFVTLECTKSTRHLSTKATTHTQKGHFSLLNITNTCCKCRYHSCDFFKMAKKVMLYLRRSAHPLSAGLIPPWAHCKGKKRTLWPCGTPEWEIRISRLQLQSSGLPFQPLRFSPVKNPLLTVQYAQAKSFTSNQIGKLLKKMLSRDKDRYNLINVLWPVWLWEEGCQLSFLCALCWDPSSLSSSLPQNYRPFAWGIWLTVVQKIQISPEAN